MPNDKKTPLQSIRTQLFSRGLALAKASIKAAQIARSGNSDWLAKAESLMLELGELKGSAMKLGQTLSMYGEHLLPKEVNEVLKKLQQDSPPLDWQAIEPILVGELGTARLSELEIEKDPIAAASIGQVHKARVRSSGQELAIKIQYPGVDKAIDSDLKLLKMILSLSDLVPRGARFDQIFDEIQEMMHQETNYDLELKTTNDFYDLLKDEALYRVPKALSEFSTRRVLSTDYVHAARVDSKETQSLSLERRNRLGLAFLELYLQELFIFRRMQTDPHLGNYRIQIGSDMASDRLVLFDFGAVRSVPDSFLASYSLLVDGGLNRDARLIEKGGRQLGLLQPGDPLDLVDAYVELCFMLTEPFTSGVYDWGGSDLPKRVAERAKNIAMGYKLRAPPRELIFLDRKLGGVFIFLSALKCQMDARETVLKALAGYRAKESNSG